MPASRASWAGPSDEDALSPTRRRDRLMRLLQAQRDIACAAPDLDVVFRVLADAVLRVFPAEGAIASQPEGDVVVARAAVGVTGPPVGHRIPRAGTLAGRALQTLEGQLCLDSQTDPRTQARHQRERPHPVLDHRPAGARRGGGRPDRRGVLAAGHLRRGPTSSCSACSPTSRPSRLVAALEQSASDELASRAPAPWSSRWPRA